MDLDGKYTGIKVSDGFEGIDIGVKIISPFLCLYGANMIVIIDGITFGTYFEEHLKQIDKVAQVVR